MNDERCETRAWRGASGDGSQFDPFSEERIST